MSQQLIAGVARSAMLVTLNVSLYSGRKKDSATQAEVVAAKSSHSPRAASVYKNLFSDCKELDAITKFQARARARHYHLTLPWQDGGSRLLPTAAFMTYTQEMGDFRTEFDRLVTVFLDKYDTLVAAAAFQLGQLFDRSEYLTRDQVARRFNFDLTYAPMPTAGDFRLDIEAEVQQQLVQNYEARLVDQLAQAQKDAWSRMHDALSRLKDRLTLEEDGTRKTFRSTTITNAQELCELLTQLNVTNDPELERARRQLEEAMDGVDPVELRNEEGVRLVTLQKVSAVLDSFDWGVEEV